MKIKRIEIENFKLFDKKFDKVSDISDAALVLLNGPNGYGKTSIFDAIELVLTGEIKRIHKYSDELGIKKNEPYIKKILIADEKKEAYIKLWLEGTKEELELQCIYEPSKEDTKKVAKGRNKENKGTKENNPHTIFDDFKRKLIVDGEVYSETGDVNRKLNEYQLNQIGDFFDKCCFISQDEHLSFLKKANKDKAAALQFLFEIPPRQQEEADRVGRLIEQLKNKNTKRDLGYITRIEREEAEINGEIEQLIDEIRKAAAENEAKITYQCLFPGKLIEWDKENVSLDTEKYDEAIEEIEKLKFFSENQQACIDYLYNKPYKDIIKPFNGSERDICRENPLEYTYRYYSLLKEEQTLEIKYALQKKYEILKENIDKRELEKINWNFILEEKLLEEKAVESIKEKLAQVSGLQKTQGIVSGVVANITETRTTLMRFVNDAVKQSIIDDKACPLCGAPYTDKAELDAQIKTQTDILQNLCDNTVQEIKKIKDDLYKNYFDGLSMTVENKLKNKISEDRYQKLQEIKKRKVDINKISELLQQIAIELPEEYQNDIVEIDKGYQNLVQSISGKLKKIL